MRASDLLQSIYRSLIWRIPTERKVIYLTFDDGPIPDVTPFILEQLKTWNAKATFFCIGNNVQKHQSIYDAIIRAGHCIGNHTQNHLNGWNTHDKIYYKNILECKKLVVAKIFRPPYGKIKFSQIKLLRKKFRIVMWDVLSKDYDSALSGEECYQRVVRQTRPGSIIVFHDSEKAKERLYYSLPKTLKYFSEKGYVFESLSFL